jgi:hypothetical protein
MESKFAFVSFTATLLYIIERVNGSKMKNHPLNFYKKMKLLSKCCAYFFPARDLVTHTSYTHWKSQARQ